MSTEPTDEDLATGEEQEFCYGHPRTPTRLHCSRCDRPICGRCAIPATVGQHCPECVAEARRSAPKVRTALAASAPITRAILILTVLVFAGQILIPGLTNLLGMRPDLAADGEWWRFVTPMLVHGGAFHLLMNGYVLFAIGPAVEQRYGSARFAAIYLLAGIGGSVASFALNDCGILGVGASGAILGLLGALIADLYQRRSSPNARMQLKSMLQWVGFIFAFGIVTQVLAALGVAFFLIDNYAHGGGLVTGAVLGWALGTEAEPLTPRSVFISLALGVAVVTVVAARIADFSC
ncbi:MAG TPA: rhomboid family intramembrane serine protease [Actinomycetota bacterium]|nr:rhomboid family intramembrane serine protease [Actinomycetota bacterium]